MRLAHKRLIAVPFITLTLAVTACGGSTVAYTGGTVAPGAISYIGPCPPAGTKHTYRWTIEAIDGGGKVLGTATTSGVFAR